MKSVPVPFVAPISSLLPGLPVAAVAAAMKQRLLDWLITADEADQIAPRWIIP